MNGYDSRERRVVVSLSARAFASLPATRPPVLSPRCRLSRARTVMNPPSRLLHAQSTPFRLRSSPKHQSISHSILASPVSQSGGPKPIVHPRIHPSNHRLASRVSARTSDNKRFFGNIFAISGGNTTCLRSRASSSSPSSVSVSSVGRERINPKGVVIRRASRRARPVARTGTRSRRRNIFRCTESAAWRRARARPRVTRASDGCTAATIPWRTDRWV